MLKYQRLRLKDPRGDLDIQNPYCGRLQNPAPPKGWLKPNKIMGGLPSINWRFGFYKHTQYGDSFQLKFARDLFFVTRHGRGRDAALFGGSDWQFCSDFLKACEQQEEDQSAFHLLGVQIVFKCSQHLCHGQKAGIISIISPFW